MNREATEAEIGAAVDAAQIGADSTCEDSTAAEIEEVFRIVAMRADSLGTACLQIEVAEKVGLGALASMGESLIFLARFVHRGGRVAFIDPPEKPNG